MMQVQDQSKVAPSAETPPGDEAAAQAQSPMMVEMPVTKTSRWPLVVIGAAVGLVVLGLAVHRGGPSKAEAKAKDNAPAANYKAMTTQQLMDDAGLPAAMELARRMNEGVPADRAALQGEMTSGRNPRLLRNLATAMALEAQKRQQAMMVNMERQVNESEGRGRGD